MGASARERPQFRRPSGPPIATLAVQHPPAELSLQVALHLEQLQAEELRLEDGAVLGEASGPELVDQGVSLGRLLGHGSDRPLEDVALAVSHDRKLPGRELQQPRAGWRRSVVLTAPQGR
jgi:hypothetical protein